ncbi:MAG: glycosyltransferase family 25 protein [Pseudomonadota bacterium]
MSSASSVGLFCINLPKETGRRAFMTEQAEAAGLDLSFVEAIHGSELERPFDRYGYDEALARVTKEIMPPNEVACFLSHRRALERFLASDFAYGLILEDDVAIDVARLRTALASLDWIDERLGHWDILRLQGPRHSRRIGLYSRGPLTICCCIKYTSGALALLYNRRSAAKVLARTERFWLPWDIQLGRNWESGLDIFELTPFAVELTRLPTTIGHAGKPRWPRPTLGAKLAHIRWQVGGELARRAMFLGQCLHPLRRRLARPGTASSTARTGSPG